MWCPVDVISMDYRTEELREDTAERLRALRQAYESSQERKQLMRDLQEHRKDAEAVADTRREFMNSLCHSHTPSPPLFFPHLPSLLVQFKSAKWDCLGRPGC